MYIVIGLEDGMEIFEKEGITMDMQEIKRLIYQGEKVDIECKRFMERSSSEERGHEKCPDSTLL